MTSPSERIDPSSPELQPGELIESMQAGLNQMAGVEAVFGAIQAKQDFLLRGSFRLKELQSVVDTLQQAPEIDKEILDFLEAKAEGKYQHVYYAVIGVATHILKGKDEYLRRQRNDWQDRPEPKKWLGRHVILRPPSLAVAQTDNWGSQAPRYRELGDGTVGPYHGGGEHNGHTLGFYGKLGWVSLEQGGSAILQREDGGATEVTDMFEAVEDSETGEVAYVPRLAIEAESFAARGARRTKNAAIKRRLGSVLEELA